MSLDEWLKANGYGSKTRLLRDARVAWRVIERACERRASLESAEKIHAATHGAVELWHMTPARERPALSDRVVPSRVKRAARA